MATKVTVTGLAGLNHDSRWTRFADKECPPTRLLIEVSMNEGGRYLAVYTGDALVYWEDGRNTYLDATEAFSDDRWRLARPGQSVLIEAVAD